MVLDRAVVVCRSRKAPQGAELVHTLKGAEPSDSLSIITCLLFARSSVLLWTLGIARGLCAEYCCAGRGRVMVQTQFIWFPVEIETRLRLRSSIDFESGPTLIDTEFLENTLKVSSEEENTDVLSSSEINECNPRSSVNIKSTILVLEPLPSLHYLLQVPQHKDSFNEMDSAETNTAAARLKEVYPDLFLKKKQIKARSESDIIVVGCGTSAGMPRLGCLLESMIQRPTKCDVCLDALTPNSKNRRRNPSILIRYKGKHNILIDCGKTFRESMVNLIARTGITRIDAVIITHQHSDAILGLDDLREFTENHAVPVYVSDEDFPTIQRVFPYLVDTSKSTGSGYVSKIQWKQFSRNESFDVLGLTFTPLRLDHGPGNYCLGYAFGKILYLSDLVGVTPEARQTVEQLMKNEAGDIDVDLLFIDALLFHHTNASHWNLVQSMKLIQEWKPKKTLLVGMGHEFDYRVTNNVLQRLKVPYEPELEVKKEKKDKSWKEGKTEKEIEDIKKKKRRTIESVLRKDIDRSVLVDVEMSYDGLCIPVDLPQ
ncbi:Hydrolase-like protein [Planoprotostelium fungivorum]|uniref:Hydrolase-like protein n=1 Tax=Planoprotostelium fungivorum TaxID=1890364 RepID=A0A2P6NQI1_9EUKA|nr:Hydrolase-like protein [Planoprotostelium fungivorum]